MTEQELADKYANVMLERLNKKLDEYIKAVDEKSSSLSIMETLSNTDSTYVKLLFYKSEEKGSHKSEFISIDNVNDVINRNLRIRVLFYERLYDEEETTGVYKNVAMFRPVRNSKIYNKVKKLVEDHYRDVSDKFFLTTCFEGPSETIKFVRTDYTCYKQN